MARVLAGKVDGWLASFYEGDMPNDVRVGDAGTLSSSSSHIDSDYEDEPCTVVSVMRSTRSGCPVKLTVQRDKVKCSRPGEVGFDHKNCAIERDPLGKQFTYVLLLNDEWSHQDTWSNNQRAQGLSGGILSIGQRVHDFSDEYDYYYDIHYNEYPGVGYDEYEDNHPDSGDYDDQIREAKRARDDARHWDEKMADYAASEDAELLNDEWAYRRADRSKPEANVIDDEDWTRYEREEEATAWTLPSERAIQAAKPNMGEVYDSLTLAGTLTRNPEMRFAGSGLGITKFSIGIIRPTTNRDETSYIDVVAWDDHNYKLAEICNANLRLGMEVLVEGRLKIQNVHDENLNMRTYTEIIISNLQIVAEAAPPDRFVRVFEACAVDAVLVMATAFVGTVGRCVHILRRLAGKTF